jgi:hypothetical protein
VTVISGYGQCTIVWWGGHVFVSVLSFVSPFGSHCARGLEHMLDHL